MIITSIPSAKEDGSNKTDDIQRVVFYCANYIGDEEKEATLPIIHNLHSTNIHDISKEFIENYKHCKPRQGGKLYHHEVIAFSPLDKEKLTDEILQDITEEYLKKRAKNALAYANVHRDKDHIHVHIIISPNLIGSNKRLRLSQKEYATIQHDMEIYSSTKYPHLTKSNFYGITHNKYVDIAIRKQKERELIRRIKSQVGKVVSEKRIKIVRQTKSKMNETLGVRNEILKNERDSTKKDVWKLLNKDKIDAMREHKKQMLADQILGIAKKSEHQEAFVENLKNENISYYDRGGTRKGITIGERNYGFENLGIHHQINGLRADWENRHWNNRYTLLHNKLPYLMEVSRSKDEFIRLLSQEGIRFREAEFSEVTAKLKDWKSITKEVGKIIWKGNVPHFVSIHSVPKIEVNGVLHSFDELGITQEYDRWQFMWKMEKERIIKNYREKKHDSNKIYALQRKINRSFETGKIQDFQKSLIQEGVTITGNHVSNYGIKYENEWYSIKSLGMVQQSQVKYWETHAQLERRKKVNEWAKKAQTNYEKKFGIEQKRIAETATMLEVWNSHQKKSLLNDVANRDSEHQSKHVIGIRSHNIGTENMNRPQGSETPTKTGNVREAKTPIRDLLTKGWEEVGNVLDTTGDFFAELGGTIIGARPKQNKTPTQVNGQTQPPTQQTPSQAVPDMTEYYKQQADKARQSDGQEKSRGR